jgi:hypothetical protein
LHLGLQGADHRDKFGDGSPLPLLNDLTRETQSFHDAPKQSRKQLS